jgi:hypothetical protein
VPDGDDVVMKGSDEVRGEQSFSAFPQVRVAQATLTGAIPVDDLPTGLAKTSALASHTEGFGQNNTATLTVMIYFLLAPRHPDLRLDLLMYSSSKTQGLLCADLHHWIHSLSVSQGAHSLSCCQQTFNDSSPVSVPLCHSCRTAGALEGHSVSMSDARPASSGLAE